MVKKRHHKVKKNVLSINTSGTTKNIVSNDEGSVLESYLTLDTIQHQTVSSDSDSLATTDYATMSKNDLLGLEEYTVDQLKKINRAFNLPITCADDGKRRNYRKDELYGNIKTHLKTHTK